MKIIDYHNNENIVGNVDIFSYYSHITIKTFQSECHGQFYSIYNILDGVPVPDQVKTATHQMIICIF